MFCATRASVAALDTLHRTFAGGKTGRQRRYFGPRPAASKNQGLFKAVDTAVLEPQAFMVEQDDGYVLGAHYHYVDQFQLVVDGSGSLGRHEVKPFSVHFSNAGTGYGPITPSPCGLKYLTVRASSDTNGTQNLPETRDQQPAGRKRNVVFDDITADLFDGGPISGGSRTLIEEAEGLAIVLVTLGEGETSAWKGEHEGRAVATIVLAGDVTCRDDEYEPLSVLFASPDEEPIALRAGAGGAAVLVMQFPR